MTLDQELSIKKLLNIVQEQRGERISWYMGSLQPEAEGSPTPEVAEAASFERLLPDVLRYPLAASILVSRLVSVKEDMNNALLLTPIDQSYPSEWR